MRRRQSRRKKKCRPCESEHVTQFRNHVSLPPLDLPDDVAIFPNSRLSSAVGLTTLEPLDPARAWTPADAMSVVVPKPSGNGISHETVRLTEMERGRAAVARRSREEKAAAAARLAEENEAMRLRIAASMARGRDAKSLDDKTRAARQEVAERRRREKAEAEAQLKKENARLAARLAGTGMFPDTRF